MHRTIRSKMKETKNKWIADKCEEVEELHRKHDSVNFHRKLKEVTGTFSKNTIDSIRLALKDHQKGIKVNGTLINNIRYADDTAILGDNVEDLQELVNSVNEIGTKYGLTINAHKTKLMFIGRQQHGEAQLLVNGNNIERVNKFKYLKCMLN
ncbi:uncharacterized protein LOC130902166 [Diorhabda carinulata]|uniref:uncharacterized protein LOC130902166 n=1 Tax=Diorhabda carinulata TaxID=1163345 RepID=UPI0025A14BBC|nr:uncharacterized protein LOC130902166 [Diorhabda carinulata]